MFPLLVLKSGSQNFILSQSVLAHSRVLEALASWSYLITIKDAIPHIIVFLATRMALPSFFTRKVKKDLPFSGL